MVVTGDAAARIPKRELVVALANRYREELAKHPRSIDSAGREIESLLARDGLSADHTSELGKELTAELTGFGVLQKLIDDHEVTEIMVNGPEQIFVERAGKISRSDLGFRDVQHLRAILERLLSGSGRRIDDTMPLVDAAIGSGVRLNAVLPPVSEYPLITIRKSVTGVGTMDYLVKAGSLTPSMAAFLHAAVIAKCDLAVSGGAGAGKTTVLSALTQLVPTEERIVVLEDTREVPVNHEHAVSLQCRVETADGSREISMRDLVRNSLRMRPDRILVGEIRGVEVADLVMAMNTGHEGCMTTIHANSAVEVLDRLHAMMSLAWPGLDAATSSRWVTSALDLVVHCERDGQGNRRIAEISAVDEGVVRSIWLYNRERQSFVTNLESAKGVLEKMRSRGIDFPKELLDA